MQTEMLPFLQEGVRQYVEAKKTVTAFEEAIWDTLSKVVDTRKHWSPLLNPRPKNNRAIGGGGKDGYWIATAISGQSPHKEEGEVEIDCGFWWTFDKPNEAIIYTGFLDKPINRVRFEWNDQEGGILSFEAYKRTFLYIPLPESLEVQDPLNRLLDALLKRLE